MEATIDKLEAMFEKAESDLDAISRKLDVEFTNDSEDFDESNPAKMLERLQEVKKEYTDIMKEAEEIRNLQKDAAEFFQTQLMAACQAVANLQVQSGEFQPLDQDEEWNKAAELLGIQLPEVMGNKEDSETHVDAETLANGHDSSCSSGSLRKGGKPQSNCQKDDEVLELSAYDRRKNTSEFLEVSKEEFNTVSDLIRGRVKLDDVNKCYRLLWTHFREEGNTEPLTSSEMHRLGLRVTGVTGEAKLKVLRALKLLHISSKGAVKLL